jgi:hypothetical protein
MDEVPIMEHLILTRTPTENRNVCNICDFPNLSRIQKRDIHIRCTACGNGFTKKNYCNTRGCVRRRPNVEVATIYGDEMTYCAHCCK